MSSGNEPFDEVAALRFLRARGYEVRKRGRYLKKTFEVEDSVYNAFRGCQEALGLRVKDAVNTALIEWIDKHHCAKK